MMKYLAVTFLLVSLLLHLAALDSEIDDVRNKLQELKQELNDELKSIDNTVDDIQDNLDKVHQKCTKSPDVAKIDQEMNDLLNSYVKDKKYNFELKLISVQALLITLEGVSKADLEEIKNSFYPNMKKSLLEDISAFEIYINDHTVELKEMVKTCKLVKSNGNSGKENSIEMSPHNEILEDKTKSNSDLDDLRNKIQEALQLLNNELSYIQNVVDRTKKSLDKVHKKCTKNQDVIKVDQEANKLLSPYLEKQKMNFQMRVISIQAVAFSLNFGGSPQRIKELLETFPEYKKSLQYDISTVQSNVINHTDELEQMAKTCTLVDPDSGHGGSDSTKISGNNLIMMIALTNIFTYLVRC